MRQKEILELQLDRELDIIEEAWPHLADRYLNLTQPLVLKQENLDQHYLHLEDLLASTSTQVTSQKKPQTILII